MSEILQTGFKLTIFENFLKIFGNLRKFLENSGEGLKQFFEVKFADIIENVRKCSQELKVSNPNSVTCPQVMTGK